LARCKLRTIHAYPALLGIVAAGLIGFALYCIADARYRRLWRVFRYDSAEVVDRHVQPCRREEPGRNVGQGDRQTRGSAVQWAASFVA
jgi:hypothetical protein